jgi:hypothetical protein
MTDDLTNSIKKIHSVILSHRIRLILKNYVEGRILYSTVTGTYKLTLAALQVFLTSSIMSSTMMAILLFTSPTTYRGGRSYHHHAFQVYFTFLLRSVTFWYGSESLPLTDSDPDPPLHPTPFFRDLKDAKMKFFCSKFFLIILYIRRHIIFSLKNLMFCKKFCVNILLCKH